MLVGLFSIFAAIAVIIFLMRKNWKLGWAMFTGSFIIALLGGFTFSRAVGVFASAILSSTTIFLTLTITAITVFGYLLQKTSSLQAMIDNMGRLFHDFRALLMLIPALVGLLTVPGGAVFSAPLVEPLGRKLNMDVDSTAAVNVVFRHIFFGIFPFYASLLLLTEISGTGLNLLVRYHFPVTLFAVPLAYLFFFRRVLPPAPPPSEGESRGKLAWELLQSMLPFIVVIVLGVGFNLYFPLALMAGILYVILVGNQKSGKRSLSAIKSRLLMVWPGINWFMALAIIGIMVFKDFVQASGALDDLSVVLLDLGIPLLLLAILFPLITGFITGNQAASLGISVPLFLPLLPPEGLGVAYLSVMFMTSLVGYNASPFHLCLVLTAEYFEASLPRVSWKVFLGLSPLVVLALLQIVFYL